MKKSNITLFLVFLAVIGFLIYIAYRNEKKPAPEYPEQEKINIKEIPIPMVPEELEHAPIEAKG